MEYTAEFKYLELALKSRWPAFQTLVLEMTNFIPGPKRPELTESGHRNYQFYLRFQNRFMIEYVLVVLASQALCEATINAMLAIGFASRGEEDRFHKAEGKPFIEKWLIGPKAFAPEYEFATSTALYKTLLYLTKQRKALGHSKIELRIEGNTVLPGSAMQPGSYPEHISWLRRIFSLPFDLSTYASNKIGDPSVKVLFDSSPIERVPEHEVDGH